MQDYNMFTKEGDEAVHKIVTEAQALAGVDGPSNAVEQAWNWALGELDALGRFKATEEATDTAVREAVREAIV